MSELIRKNRNFLSLILSTSQEQQKAIINSITDNQALLLSEIFLNILELEHSERDFRFLKSKVGVLDKLAKHKFSKRSKRGFVKKHKLVILRILLHFKDELQELL